MHRRACGIGNFAATATLLDPRHGNFGGAGVSAQPQSSHRTLTVQQGRWPCRAQHQPALEDAMANLYTYRFAPITPRARDQQTGRRRLVQESFPTVAPNGDVYVAFLQFQGGFGSTLPHSGVWVAKSTDGGETFTQQKVADIRQIPSPIPPGGTHANDGNNSFRTGTIPAIGVTNDGTVHLAWGEWIGTDAEVKYVRSIDGGFTWTAPVSMNDVPTGHQFFPSLTTDGDNVHVIWYDSRLNGPAGTTIEDLDVFYNRSADAGATFQADVRMTERAFDPNEVSRFPVFCAAFIGDYVDIDAVNGKVAAIWNDNRNVVDPLTPAECDDFQPRSTDPTIQADLDDGSLDQEAFVDVFDIPLHNPQYRGPSKGGPR
jgi:hypothetical protein